MKILHIINSLATGGAEKLILDTIPKYNEAGIKADVLLLNGTAHSFLDELKKMNCCEIFVLGESSPYQLKFIGKLIPYFKKYDVIHAHLFPSNYFAAASKRISRSRTPLVMTEHNTSNRRFRSRKLLWLNKTVYKTFNKIICITDEVKEVVSEKTKVPSDRLTVIHNGVDTHKYEHAVAIPRSEIDLRLTEEDFLLVQVSSFREQKDQGTAIRALTSLPQNVKLLLAGDGPLKADHEILVKDLSLADRVLFLGNRSDIPAVLKTCDAVLLSSKYEGLSLASIEGMASGKPFIASEVPGLAGVVRGYGVLFPQGNAEMLANEILKLINNKEVYNEVSLKCTERAKDFDIDKMVREHIELYNSLIKK